MHSQITILTAIEEHIIGYLNYNNNPVKLTCEYCKINFTVDFQFRDRKFCSKNCYSKSRTRFYICNNCGIEFKPKFRLKPKFCSKTCSHDYAKGKNKATKYSKYNYCQVCVKWFPKQDAIMKEKGKIIKISYNSYRLKRNNYYCHICKSRLIVKKDKTREQDIKRIE